MPLQEDVKMVFTFHLIYLQIADFRYVSDFSLDSWPSLQNLNKYSKVILNQTMQMSLTPYLFLCLASDMAKILLQLFSTSKYPYVLKMENIVMIAKKPNLKDF